MNPYNVRGAGSRRLRMVAMRGSGAVRERLTERMMLRFLTAGPARSGKTEMASAFSEELIKRANDRKERRAARKAEATAIAAVMAQPSKKPERARKARREAERKATR